MSRALAALLLATSLAACGVKGAPRPPVTKHPNAAPAGEPEAPAPDAARTDPGSCR